MVKALRSSLAVALGALALGALALPVLAQAPEPGVTWESTVEMEGMGVVMPGTTSRFCAPRSGLKEPPRDERGDGACKITDVKNDGKRMTWKMACEDGTSGEGQMTYGKDRYDGVMTMAVQGGMAMKMKMKGRLVGGQCDAGAQKRQVESMRKQAEAQQALAADHQAQAAAQLCESSLEQMNHQAFTDPASPFACKDARAKAEFCARLSSWQGLSRLQASFGADALARSAKACKKDPAALPAAACKAALKDASGSAPAADALEYVAEACPAEKTALVQRECAGRSFTGRDAPAAAYYRFCTAYAGDLLKKAPPASPKDAAVEGGKKLLKGLFGR